MSLRSPHHQDCPMASGGDWCNCFKLRHDDEMVDRAELEHRKYEAVRKQAARECAEIAATHVDWDASIAVKAVAQGIAMTIKARFGL